MCKMERKKEDNITILKAEIGSRGDGLEQTTDTDKR